MINWDQVIDSTPKTLRAFILIVLLGLIVFAVIVLSLAVLKGQGFKAWGIEVQEYKSPEVQKCALLMPRMPEIIKQEEESFKQLNEQIIALVNEYSVATDFTQKNEYITATKDLRERQNQIIARRTDMVAEAVKSCSLAHLPSN